MQCSEKDKLASCGVRAKLRKMASCYCGPRKHFGGDFQHQRPRQQRSTHRHSSFEPYQSFDHIIAGSPPSDSIDKTDMEINNDNWDVWQSILNEKIQHIQDMGDKSNLASVELPSKTTPNLCYKKSSSHYSKEVVSSRLGYSRY